MATSFRDLTVWQRGIQLSVAIYKLIKGFPPTEAYGLTNQLRRASVSIPSNIAEGWGRQSEGDYRRFLTIARGSNMELQTQLTIANELDFGTKMQRDMAEQLSHKVGKMLAALIKSLRQRACC